MRRLASSVLIVLAIVIVGADAPPEGGLEIYFIDVDGGAATLLVTPDRESVLIDSGWPGRDGRDPKRIVHVLKDVAKLDRLDHLITTHWHMDHFGGVEGLAQLVEIRHFWDRGLPEDGTPGLDFPDGPKADDPMGIAYRKASAGKRSTLKAGDKLPIAGVEALVLAASGEVLSTDARYSGTRLAENERCASAPPDRAIDGSDNARSVTILFSLGEFAFLDCGDLTWNVEKELVCPFDLIGPVDLFQVTHHGMDISNHPTLLETIAPRVAVMDNGPRKGGSPATVKRLRALPSLEALYQLHKNAATGAAENTSADLIANRDPKGGEFVRVTVAPDGSHFSVRIGADGPAREFPSR